MSAQIPVPAAPRIRFKQGKGGPFYNAVRKRVDEYFARTKKSRFADASVWIKGAIYFSIALAAYALILFGGYGPWVMLLLANIYGVASLLFAVNIGHDGAHAALSPRKWINDAALYGSFMLIGADPYLWRL